MQEQLHSSLKKIKKTINLYQRFISDNHSNWTDKEVDVAEKTLKNLVSFESQIQNKIHTLVEYSQQEKEHTLYSLEKIDIACKSILEHLEELY